MAVLGEAVNVIAIVKILQKVLSLCGKYYSAIKYAEKDIKCLYDKITALYDILKKVEELIKDLKTIKLRGLTPLVGQLKQCLYKLNNLKNRLDLTQARKIRWRLRHRALKWPFIRENVKKEITTLNGYKTTFNLTLTINQI